MRKILYSTMPFRPHEGRERRMSVVLVLLLPTFFALSFSATTQAQKITGRVTIPKNFNKGSAIAPVDYFLKDTDPYVKNDVFQRERYHMGQEWREALRNGKLQRALGDLDFVLRYVPNHPKALALVALISRVGGNPVVANLYFQRALQKFPQRALTHAQYGKFLVEVGKANEGIVRLEKAISMDPNLAIAHLWLARMYARAGKSDLANQEAQRAKELRARETVASTGNSQLDNTESLMTFDGKSQQPEVQTEGEQQ